MPRGDCVAQVKLLIQPRDGVSPLLAAIKHAKASIQVVIFRCNYHEIAHALHAAVLRGVKVHALIAHTNHGGAARLRRLEQRLLGAGATVDRTGEDFVRYHGKFMVIDHELLLVLGFNFTVLDITRSRSFGIVTRERSAVQAAIRLFRADCARQPYTGDMSLVVSPEVARAQLSAFISKAKRQLLIYDPKVNDPRIVHLLKERTKAGVDVRIIGKVGGHGHELVHQKFPGHRLHVRAIVRDGRHAFIGSQSLRALELDKRREVGMFVKSAHVVNELASTFEADWAQTGRGQAVSRPVLKRTAGLAASA